MGGPRLSGGAVAELTPLTLSTSVDMVDVEDARALPLELAVSGGNLGRTEQNKKGVSRLVVLF